MVNSELFWIISITIIIQFHLKNQTYFIGFNASNKVVKETINKIFDKDYSNSLGENYFLRTQNSIEDEKAIYEIYGSLLFIGILSIEQNKVIKIFTIVNVIFLPPTLIASIYGMNFDFIPELHWEYGYLISIIFMVIASITPILIFKKKGWI